MKTARRSGWSEWSEIERAAWQPPEKLTVSQWSERYRVLSRRQSSRPGEWRNANSPCLVGVMDLCAKPQVKKLNIKKAAQLGASEALRNVIGFFAHLEPDPMLLVLPDEKAGRSIMKQRILPLIEDTPVLRELGTQQKRDRKISEISLLNGFVLRLGWAGSASSLASHPARIVINDEVDKMKAWVGKEADPISLAEVRTATYENSLIVNLSTPTTRLGLITQLYENSTIRLEYFVPCPLCGAYQTLRFDRLKWAKPGSDEGAQPQGAQPQGPKGSALPGNSGSGESGAQPLDPKRHAAWIEAHAAAWYECEKCSGKILESHRPRMLCSGYWGTADAGYKLYYDGHEEGTWPLGSEVGMLLHTLHSLAPKHRFARIAAEIIRSAGDAMKVQNLRNSWQAEVFEQQVTDRGPDIFAAKCREGHPARLLPHWTGRLILTADTQKDYFPWVIRAWGPGFISRRIAHGKALSFEELRALAFESWWSFEDDPQRAAQCCDLLGIDSGGGVRVIDPYGIDASRTDQVYQFALSDRHRILAMRGEGNPRSGQAIWASKVTYTPPRGRSSYQVWLHHVDVGWFQDLLDSRLDMKRQVLDVATGEETEEPIWQLNAEDDPDYNRQLASMHKIVVNPRSREMRWVTKTAGAANHYRDCEVEQIALAYGPGKVGQLAPAGAGREKTGWFAARKRGRDIHEQE